MSSLARVEPATAKRTGLAPEIDYNQALWTAYMNCIMLSNAPSESFSTNHASVMLTLRFTEAVKTLYDLILPEWYDEPFFKAYGSDGNGNVNFNSMRICFNQIPHQVFKDITQLLHRRGFFQQDKVSLLP